MLNEEEKVKFGEILELLPVLDPNKKLAAIIIWLATKLEISSNLEEALQAEVVMLYNKLKEVQAEIDRNNKGEG